MRKMRILLIALAVSATGAGFALASGGVAPPDAKWSWDGPFGSFDRAQLQRGLQVYTEICRTCHSLNLLSYRDIAALGYSEEEVKAYAANYEVEDGPNDEGEMFTREALPSDRFVPPFPNEQAARVANNGALPPDLSLMVKARKNGADYVHGILTGYEAEVPADAPKGFVLGEGMAYNHYFPGNQIAMPQPLYGGDVEFADGTEATHEQEAADVTAFLTWAAEPKMEERKAMGIGVLAFLGILFVMTVAVKKAVWRDVKK